LLQHVGNVLAMQHKMVGRVETGEALDRKLDVVSRTVETVLGLVQTRSSTRVEWYIVLLIVAELVLAAYSLLLNR
jgi:uncharacterized Rmd1/YagE family protein